MENEIWKEIENYPKYRVSNMGRVVSIGHSNIDRWGRKRIKHDRILSLSDGSRRMGYPFVSIHNSKGKKMENIHRIVAIAFIPNPHNKPCVNHINNIRHDNRVENLEWCTASENIKHCINQDRHPSVIKKADVKRLVGLWETGNYTLKQLGEMENKNWGTLSHLLYRNSNYRKNKMSKRPNKFFI